MLKVIELFAGIGSQRAALDRAGIPHEVVGVSEIDKYAYAAYQAIHGETKNFGDITKIERLPYADFWTYSFPCTDISLAGKQQGLQHESKQEQGLLGMLFDEPTATHVKPTRSGLLYEVQRLLWVAKGDNTLPMYLMLENVKALVGSKFMGDFQGWLDELDMLGYNSYWKVLNGKEFGIPQNRERVFVVSIRKDADDGKFKFPQRFPLVKRLKDLLEENVDEKYYLSDKQIAQINSWNSQTNPINEARTLEDEAIQTITAKSNTSMNASMLLLKEQPKIAIPEDTKQGYALAEDGDGVYINRPHQKRGTVQKGMIQTLTTHSHIDVGVVVLGNYSPSNHEASRILDSQGIAPTIKENHGTVNAVIDSVRIRKLTPRECFRLMGFTDGQFDRAASVCSNSQLYKQAGNAIIIDVLYYIFINLFKECYNYK